MNVALNRYCKMTSANRCAKNLTQSSSVMDFPIAYLGSVARLIWLNFPFVGYLCLYGVCRSYTSSFRSEKSLKCVLTLSDVCSP